MSEDIQMIFIICLTIVICCGLICDSMDKKGKYNNRLHNKIGHNPPPPKDFEKPSFPTYPRPLKPGTKTYDSIINIKPPSK